MKQVTNSPDIPMFKKIKENWSTINPKIFMSGYSDQKCQAVLEDKKEEILNFLVSQLQIKQIRDDYRELLELFVLFLGSDDLAQMYNIKIRSPGAIHQARWMSRAIYCMEIFMLWDQLKFSKISKASLGDICVLIVRLYIKVWFECVSAINEPHNDLQFLKDLKLYESINRSISKEAFAKFTHHLWYLSEETVGFAFFDDNIPIGVKEKMVEASRYPANTNYTKRFVAKEIDDNFIGLSIFLNLIMKIKIYVSTLSLLIFR